MPACLPALKFATNTLLFTEKERETFLPLYMLLQLTTIRSVLANLLELPDCQEQLRLHKGIPLVVVNLHAATGTELVPNTTRKL